MKVRIITALFDIKRDTKGDGRGIDDYLSWFKDTLNLNCNMTIYTEERFKYFVEENRKNINYDTDIIIQKLEDIPFYKWRIKIKEIIDSDYFKLNMRDLNRIECYLPEYNVIQYSKFGWLVEAVEKNEDDYFFWMDAGCSRFFGNFDINCIWPDTNKLDINKFIIQGNSNYISFFKNLNIDNYIWDNNCVLVGTLFGGGREIIKKLNIEINNIFEYLLSKDCVNNEQFALAIFAKKNPDIMDTKIILDGTHLPLFNFLK